MTDTLETLTEQYKTAHATFMNSRIGPKTDKAEARMEKILARAEKLGLADELCKALGH